MAASLLASPEARRLGRDIATMQAEIERLHAGLRATQLGESALYGTILIKDGAGVTTGAIGQQADGSTGVVPTGGPPPPRPTGLTITPQPAGVQITWDGSWAGGAKPLNVSHVRIDLSSTGANFANSDATLAGTLSTAGTLPVAPLPEGTQWWARITGVSTSVPPVQGPSSATVGPAVPELVVAQDVLDGIVTETKIADGAATQAKVAAAAIGPVQLGSDAVTQAKIAAGAVIARSVAADSIQTQHLVAAAVQAAQIAAGAVLTDKLAANAVTANKIAALAIQAAHIAANAITAGHITAGAVTAEKLAAQLVIATRLIAGSASGTRAEVNQGGFEAWSGSLQTFDVDSATGNVMMLGTYKSAPSGERVEIPRDGDLTFFNSSNQVAGRILNNGTELAFRGGSGTNAGHLRLSANYVAINWGTLGQATPASFGADGAGIQTWGRLIGMRYMQQYAGDGTEPRVFMLGTDNNGNDIGRSVVHVSKRTFDGFATIMAPGADAGIAFVSEGSGPEVYVVNGNTNQAFRAIRASAFNVGSSAVTKQDVEEIQLIAGRSSWDLIEGAPSQQWRYVDDAPAVTTPADEAGRPLMVRKRNPAVASAAWELLPDGDGRKWIWEPMEPPPAARTHTLHRFPVAEDLLALAPSLVRGDPARPESLAVDIRDAVGILWDAVDMLIKRGRLLEAQLATRIPTLRLPERPQRGDVAAGIGAVVAGRTRRDIDQVTGQVRDRIRDRLTLGGPP